MVSLLGTLPSRPKTGCQTAICTATPTAAGPRQLRSEPGVEDGRTDGRTRPHGSGMLLGPERDGHSGAARSVDGPGDVYAQRDEPHTQRRKPRESRRNPRFRKAGRGGGAAPSWAQSRIPCEMSSAGGQFHSDVNPLSAPELDVQKCLRW